MEMYLGMITTVGFNFAPRGWALCNGQLMSVAQNSALFSLLGTMYGGDGITTFALPDLRGRVIVGAQGGAAGPGLAPITQGQMAGTSTVNVVASGNASFTLTTNNLPSHTHTATTAVQASTGGGGTLVPATGSSFTSTAQGPTGAAIYLPSGTTPTNPVALSGATTTVAATGSGQPVIAPVQTQSMVSVMQPYTGLNYVICLEGIYPSRN
jgi:microcystin-dependent protein